MAIRDLLCCEFELDDLLSIIAIPTSSFGIAPSAMLQPVVAPASISYTLTHAISVGREKGECAALVPMIARTGKTKDSESDATAGRSHSVEVTCEVDGRGTAVWNHLLTLERGIFCLLLTFRTGTQAIVTADEDSYHCSCARDGAETTLTFKIHNLMGIQKIEVESSE